MCVSRFDSETKSTFIDLYTKVDADAQVEEEDIYMEDHEAEQQAQSDYEDPDSDENIF